MPPLEAKIFERSLISSLDRFDSSASRIRSRAGRDKRRRPGSALPSGLAQAFQHMRVVFWPVPRGALTGIHVERRWCDSDGLFQSLFRFVDPPRLAERRRAPEISGRQIGVRADCPPRRLERGIVFAGQIVTDCPVVQMQSQPGMARVEPDAVFESDAPFL